MISIDNRYERVEYARRVMKDLELSDYVDIICGDARKYICAEENVILVFIDGKKDEYHQYLEAIENCLVIGALVIAHNTLSSAHEIVPYIKKVYGNCYKSITIATDPAGIIISVYKGEDG